MPLIRVVLDANVWVSAFAFPLPEKIALLALDRQVDSITCAPLFDQVHRTLLRLGEREMRAMQLVESVTNASSVVILGPQISAITAKDPDNRVLEYAVSGHADLIITGDRKHLLVLREFRGILIITPREFLDSHWKPETPG